MIKAFISHSSKQKKDFVESLVELLGRDSCIIDSYDFEAAYKSIEKLLQDISKAEAQFPQSPNVGRVISEFKFKQKIISSRQSYREDC